MSATHLVFVAWEAGVDGSREKIAQAEAWAKTGNKKRSTSSKGEERRFKAVIYHPQRQSEHLKKMETGQIYILGHGAAGYGSIGDIDGDVDAPLGSPARPDLLSAEEVAERLITSGLQRPFMGAIKLFNCHSGKRTNGANSFADLFANAMWDRKFSNCRIYGYTESLNSAYTEAAGDKGVLLHKYGVLHAGDQVVTRDRAKTYRVERTNSEAAFDRVMGRG